jgi:hypothetical protein
MIELQNASAKTPPPDFGVGRFLGESSSLPMRRDSNAIDDEEIRTFKKRQLSRSSTRPSMPGIEFNETPKSTSVSLSTNNFSFADSNDTEPRDGYVMITPRSERAAWPNLTSDLNALDYPMHFSNVGMPWMGQDLCGEYGGTDMDVLVGGGGQNGVGQTVGGNKELDFFQF